MIRFGNEEDATTIDESNLNLKLVIIEVITEYFISIVIC